MKKLKEKFRNNSKIITTAIVVLLCLILATAAVTVSTVNSKLDLVNRSEFEGNPDVTFSYEDESTDISFPSDDYGTINDIKYASSIQELMKKWATDDSKKMSDKDVINILLIGEDGNSSVQRSDTAMLVSINTKTKKIILTSFLRDSYSYININGKDRYDKLNHSYAWGGPKKLIETISNNYKIKIDYYVTINFNSFVDAIDALGGVRLYVSKAEANYMNKTTKIKGFKSGNDVLLDGEHALVFARIRKLDSEVNRTERQRRLIVSVINSVKDTSIGEINNLVNSFLPYVSTNCSNSKIVSLASVAVAEQWYNFDIVGNAAPLEENRTGVNRFRTYSGNLFVWIVDYIKDAYYLQTAIYGHSNIEIDNSKHISAAALAKQYVNYNTPTETKHTVNKTKPKTTLSTTTTLVESTAIFSEPANTTTFSLEQTTDVSLSNTTEPSSEPAIEKTTETVSDPTTVPSDMSIS